MSDYVKYEVHGEVAVLTMNKPPVNGLGADLRAAIVAALDRAHAEEAVRALVLTGSQRAFSGGSDVTEFGTPKAAREPNLRVASQNTFDVGRLERFMREQVDGYSGELQVEQFKGGQSNPTFRLSAGGKHYVMRRKPPAQRIGA